MIPRLRALLTESLWDLDRRAIPAWRRAAIATLRLLYAVGLDLAQGQLTLRAMSLVYTTLLSIVPLLAISFSVLKGFGVHNRIEPLLLGVLQPLGEKAGEITARIIDFVERVEVGVLGFVGFMLLFYTVVSLLQKVERSLNYVWHIDHERTLSQRFRDYLSVIVVGPALVFAAIGMTASVMSTGVVRWLLAFGPVGSLVVLAGRLLPFLMVVGAFTFVYLFIPNTRVRPRSAALGGLVAGILWVLVGWAFASIVVTSANYAAIYSTFATLILFMIWLYLGWLILLLGGSVAFYHQHPEYIGVRRGAVRFGIRLMEKVAVLIVHHVVRTFYMGGPPWTADTLAQEIGAPIPLVEQVLEALLSAGILCRSGEDRLAYIPARPPEETPARAILDALRDQRGPGQPDPRRIPSPEPVEALLAGIDGAMEEALGDWSLKDIAMGSGGRRERARDSARG